MVWSKSTSLYLYGREKIDYIDGGIITPEPSESSYTKWEINYRTFMSWLLNSINPKLAKEFLFLDSTKENWDAIGEIYGKKVNLARIYQLQHDINHAIKDDKVFLLHLKSMWDELQQHRPLSNNLEIIKKRGER